MWMKSSGDQVITTKLSLLDAELFTRTGRVASDTHLMRANKDTEIAYCPVKFRDNATPTNSSNVGPQWHILLM